MKAREIDRKLRDADRFSAPKMEWLELEPAEAALAAAILAEPAAPAAAKAPATHQLAGGRHRRGLLGAAGLAVAAVAAALVLLLGGGGSKSPSPAYGAELVRFAESTPLLLLEGPGWRVENVFQAPSGPHSPPSSRGEGTMEFVTGKPIPDETLWTEPVGEPERRPGSRFPVYRKERVSGMLPPAVRQRKVELRWSHASLAEAVSMQRRMPHPHGQDWVELPVLETTAQVDTRAEFYVNQGGPGNRRMIAFWAEDGYVLELKAAVPDLAAFEERLDWLTKVDSQTWLDAMPAGVVKAAEHDSVVREMLKGIPTPSTFKPSRIPDEGLTTNRNQVAAAVTATVSCLWFRQWGQARRTGDEAAEAEAERAMATSRRWPILREMAKEGAYPANTIWELAAGMPSGKGRRGWRLLPQAETLACARLGIPVLPWKQKRQAEREAGRPGRTSSS